MHITLPGGRPDTRSIFIEAEHVADRFRRATRQFSLDGESAVSLAPGTQCLMQTERVLRWSSDEIVEDYRVEFIVLDEDGRSVLALSFLPYDWPGFHQLQEQLTNIAATWDWPLRTEERRIDNV